MVGVDIRMATAADAAGVRAIYAPIVEATVISFELAVPGVDEIRARIIDRQPAYPWLVAEVDGAVAGYAYGGRFSSRPAYDWSVETSIYLAEPARGKGMGRALYAELLEVLTAQGYRQAMAGVTLPNPASVALHEAVGFRPVGVYQAVGWKFGGWRDVGWWQRPLGPVGDPPERPIPLTELGGGRPPEGAQA